MKINIANKTAHEVDEIIIMQTDAEFVNAIGHKSAIALIEGDVLEIRYFGEYKKPEVCIEPLCKRSNEYCGYMNKRFPV